MSIIINNVTIFTPHERLPSGWVWIEHGAIRLVAAHEDGPPPADIPRFDGRGTALVPGFIDLQINGGFGHDFATHPATMWEVASRLPAYGVTGFLPTIVTSPLDVIQTAQEVVTRRPAAFAGAEPLGLHVEGPFLNPAKMGAHNPRFLRKPSLELAAGWSPDRGVRLVTLAPELPGAEEVIKNLTGRGVIVSIGHSMATYEQTLRGLAAGISYGTHLFNAMPPWHHREPGVAGGLLDQAEVTIGIIPDGVHVHPSLVKAAWRLAGPGRLNLVTDAMAAMGMPSGRYRLGTFEVAVDNGVARLANGTLAGSVVTMDQALRNLMAFSGCSLQEALPTVTTTPANLLNLQHKGRIAPGCAADLVFLDKIDRVAATMVAGRLLFQDATIMKQGE